MPSENLPARWSATEERPTSSSTSSTRVARSGWSGPASTGGRARSDRGGWPWPRAAHPLPERPDEVVVAASVDGDRASVGRIEAHDHAHGRGLSRAIGSEETRDVSRFDIEVEGVYSKFVPVALCQPPGLDGVLALVAGPLPSSRDRGDFTVCVADCQLARFGRGPVLWPALPPDRSMPSEPQNEPNDGGDKENQHDNPEPMAPVPRSDQCRGRLFRALPAPGSERLRRRTRRLFGACKVRLPAERWRYARMRTCSPSPRASRSAKRLAKARLRARSVAGRRFCESPLAGPRGSRCHGR